MALAGLTALPAAAYVLSGPHVLQLVVDTIGQARSLLVRQRIMLPAGEPDQPAAEVKELLRYRFPNAYRSDIETQEMQRIHLVSGDKSLTVVNGRIEAESPGRIDAYKDLLLYRSRLNLHKALAGRGIEVSTCSLGRYQGKIVFVVGARYPDDTVSQLWVDQESFLPLRLLIVSAAGSTPESAEPDRLDIVYSDWRKFGKTLYPMQLAFYRNGVWLREIRVDKVEVNPALDQDAMNIERLAALYQAAPAEAPAPTDTEAQDDIQKTINDFRKKFEETEPR